MSARKLDDFVFVLFLLSQEGEKEKEKNEELNVFRCNLNTAEVISTDRRHYVSVVINEYYAQSHMKAIDSKQVVIIFKLILTIS